MQIHLLLTEETKGYEHLITELAVKQQSSIVTRIVNEDTVSMNEDVNHTFALLFCYVHPEESFWEWIRQIRDNFPRIEIVLVSRTAEFQLAYQAFQYRVTQFLLEPVQQSQLEAVLQEITEKKQIWDAEQEREQRLMILELEQHQKLMEKIMTQLMDKPEELAVMMNEINERYHTSLKNTSFFVIQLGVMDLIQVSQRDALMTEIRMLFEKELTLAEEIVLSSETGSDLRAVVNISESAFTKVLKEQIRSIEIQLNQIMDNQGITHWAVGIGPVTDSIKEVSQSAKRAVIALHEWNQNQNGRVFWFESGMESQMCGQESLLDLTKRRQCASLLRQKNLEGLSQLLQKMIQGYEKEPFRAELLVQEILELAVECWKSHMEEHLLLEILAQQEFQYVYDNHHKAAYLMRVLAEAVGQFEAETEQEKSPQILEAVRYIQEHYMEGLTLDEVALGVDLSPNYFSNLFREEMGINYLDYLRDYRLEKSRQLLLETDGTIEKIAREVGYQDVKYFSQLFKGKYETTPGKYRKTSLPV